MMMVVVVVVLMGSGLSIPPSSLTSIHYTGYVLYAS